VPAGFVTAACCKGAHLCQLLLHCPLSKMGHVQCTHSCYMILELLLRLPSTRRSAAPGWTCVMNANGCCCTALVLSCPCCAYAAGDCVLMQIACCVHVTVWTVKSHLENLASVHASRCLAGMVNDAAAKYLDGSHQYRGVVKCSGSTYSTHES